MGTLVLLSGGRKGHRIHYHKDGFRLTKCLSQPRRIVYKLRAKLHPFGVVDIGDYDGGGKSHHILRRDDRFHWKKKQAALLQAHFSLHVDF